MMKEVIFKQKKQQKTIILGTLLFIVAVALSLIAVSIKTIILLVFSLVILLYSVEYKIDSDFNNYSYVKILGIRLFKRSLKLKFPDYISVFPILLRQNNNWNMVSALGTEIKHNRIAIKLFTKKNHFTLFKTKDYQQAIDKATQLSEMLNVRLIDKTKQSST